MQLQVKEQFTASRGAIKRKVVAGTRSATSILRVSEITKSSLSHQWWQAILRGSRPKVDVAGAIRSIDLFCGSGGLSLGAVHATEALGLRHVPIAAVDLDGDALDVYGQNFASAHLVQSSVSALVDYHVYGRGIEAQLAYPPEIIDSRLEAFVGGTDILLAGPPCQGHSNLNNHTRRSDPRNMLYVGAVASGIALKASMIVIENVQDVLSDKTDVVGTARKILRDSGYKVSDHTLSATELGGAQTRKRHFLVATIAAHAQINEVAETLMQPAMTLREVIGDLEDSPVNSFMDETPILSAENQSRIDYLFDHDEYDLPNAERPDCHKNGHSYPAVYGRLDWNKPSQTITTGFMTPGRGRYIHPSRRRVLSPREAARIQGFPDTYHFGGGSGDPPRKLLAKWIGDAVPTILGYTAVLAALSGY